MSGNNIDLSLNKLIILYMISTAGLPLSNTQISAFILDAGYTDYFSLQEYIHQMIDSNLLKTFHITNHTLCDITQEGLLTLEYFESHIPESTKDEIVLYLKRNKFDIRSKFEIIADYIPEKDGQYTVECKARENNKTLIEVNLIVSNKEEALQICQNWEENNHEIYKQLLSMLLS